jgi:hypothetical protein
VLSAITIDAHAFTDPLEAAVSAALPILVLLIAAVFTVTFVIRWIQRRAVPFEYNAGKESAHREDYGHEDDY